MSWVPNLKQKVDRIDPVFSPPKPWNAPRTPVAPAIVAWLPLSDAEKWRNMQKGFNFFYLLHVHLRTAIISTRTKCFKNGAVYMALLRPFNDLHSTKMWRHLPGHSPGRKPRLAEFGIMTWFATQCRIPRPLHRTVSGYPRFHFQNLPTKYDDCTVWTTKSRPSRKRLPPIPSFKKKVFHKHGFAIFLTKKIIHQINIVFV